MLASICQSTVLHTLRLWSSAWDAMYFPTGSQVRPFTKPVCPRKHVTISGKKKADELTEFSFCMQSKSHRNVIKPRTVTLLKYSQRGMLSDVIYLGICEHSKWQWCCPHCRRPARHHGETTTHPSHLLTTKKTWVTSLFFYTYSFFCGSLTTSVVPQDSDTPPLFYISQLIAGSKHCTWTN